MSYIIKGADDKPILHQGKEIHAMDFMGVVKDVDIKARTLKMIGTDETRDRDGDIIKVSGWMLENFQKNPVFLWAHDYRSVPLAAAQKIVRKRNPASLEFLMRFPTEGLYPFADMILNLYSEGIINASSVGFIPFKWEDLTDEEKEDMPPMAQIWGGRRFLKQELLELSGCAVPSNPNALQNSMKGYGEKYNLDPEQLTRFVMRSAGNSPIDVLGANSADVYQELKLDRCTIEDDDPKIHQVPENIMGEVENAAYGEEIPDEDVSKPYPNEHACRLQDPADFEKFRRGKREHDGKTYSIIFGNKKDSDSWEEQAYRYNKDTWTAAQARAHCKNHKGSFEAATGAAQDDIEVNFTSEAICQLVKSQFGKITLYGEYSDEEGIVVDNIAGSCSPEEGERIHREMLSEEFGVDLTDGKDFSVVRVETIEGVDGAKTIRSYSKLNKGIMQFIKKEVIDSKDLEPGGKAGPVLSRKNRDSILQVRDALDEFLKQIDNSEAGEEDPNKSGAGDTTAEKTLQEKLEKIKTIINGINKSFGG